MTTRNLRRKTKPPDYLGFTNEDTNYEQVIEDNADLVSTGLTQHLNNLTLNEPTSTTGSSSKIVDKVEQNKNCESNEKELFEKLYAAQLQQERFLGESLWIKRWRAAVALPARMYVVPGGNIGRQYTDLLAKEIHLLTIGSVNAERLMFFCRVILQRDPAVRTTKDVKILVKRRMENWSQEKYDSLLQETKRVSNRISQRVTAARDNQNGCVSATFARMMMSGKVRQAMRWLTKRTAGGVLHPDDEVQGKKVLEVLKSKHPSSKPHCEDAQIEADYVPDFEDVFITADVIEKTARRIQGSAGPSGTDSDHWQAVLLRYGAQSSLLREKVAAFTNYLCNSVVPWERIQALMSGRLIALDKNPGVRPIGVGECLRRFIGKCVAETTKTDLSVVCGASQLACGTAAGIEGAVHAVSDLFAENKDDGSGLLLMDAANAFNSLNRRTSLINLRFLWPRAARFLFNTYRGFSALFVRGAKEVIFSEEGTTQGDPLAMLMYGASLVPLIKKLENRDKYLQSWYADDSAAIGELKNLKEWLDLVIREGPKYGYYPEPSKSYLVVDKKYVAQAHEIFDEYKIKIVEGKRFLGGFVGTGTEKNEFLTKKRLDWENAIDALAEVAATQPQAALSAFVKSLQCEWNYVQRVVENPEDHFAPLEAKIKDKFVPALLNIPTVSDDERNLFSLPARLGGLGLFNPTEDNDLKFKASKNATSYLRNVWLNGREFDGFEHIHNVRTARKNCEIEQNARHNDKLNDLQSRMPKEYERAVRRAVEGKTSTWLTVLPLKQDNFDLTANEFRDALAIRYCKPLTNAPGSCDGCQQSFTMRHALACKKGGLVTLRHNEIRDTVGDMVSLVWNDVRKEVVVKDYDPDKDEPALIADLYARGVYERQIAASFDIRVTDTDAQSYCSRSPISVLKSAEVEKKAKYSRACEERHISFTPLVTSVDGLLAPEFENLMKRLSDCLAAKWNKPYSHIMGWTRARLSCAIIRATSMCIRGTRTKWRSLGAEDGAALQTAFS